MDAAIVKDPEEAIRLAKRTPFTVALVDANLHGGFEGLAVARVISGSTDIPVVIMTAYSGADLAHHSNDINKTPVVFKPIDSNMITDLLRSFLRVEEEGEDEGRGVSSS